MKNAISTAFALSSLCLGSAAGAAVVTFNIPGAQAVSPSVMNDKGQLTGSYLDATGTHGFLRQQDGTITTFDVPDGQNTVPVAISRTGVITGRVAVADIHGRGFVRGVNGAIKTFKVPGGRVTTPVEGNAYGWSVGFYTPVGNSLSDQAFLRGPHHQLLEFSVPGASETVADAVNASLTIAGEVIGQGGSTSQGFVRTPDGTIVQFGNDHTNITGINDDGTIIGWYADRRRRAFVRAIDGTITTFTGPDAAPTVATSINNAGTIVGYFNGSDGFLHGYIRTADGTFTPFDIEGAASTVITDINNKGAIAGQYTNQDGAALGFIGKP